MRKNAKNHCDNLFPVFLVLLPVMEIAARLSPFCARLGSWLWLGAGLALFARAVEGYVRILLAARRPPWRAIAVVITAQLALGVYGAFLWRNLNYETAVEIACALKAFVQNDGGFLADCHFGYPARGMYLSAMPSLLFGRGLLPLQLGGLALPFIGLILFSEALLEEEARPEREPLLALTLALVPQIPYYFQSVFSYEQVTSPTALSLACIGAYQRCRRDPRFAPLALLAVLLWLAAFSYTPAMVLWAAGVAYLAVEGARATPLRRPLYHAIAISVFFAGLASLYHRADFRVADPLFEINPGVSHAQRVWLLVKGFLWPPTKSGMSFPFAWGVIVFAGWLMRGVYGPLTTIVAAICASGVVLSAVLKLGISDFVPPVSLYRGGVFFPPLLFLFYRFLVDKSDPPKRAKRQAVRRRATAWRLTAVAAVLYMVVFWLTFLGKKPGEHVARMVPWLQAHYPTDVPLQVSVSPWVENIRNHPLSDFVPYFFPNAVVTRIDANCQYPSSPGVVALSEYSPCFSVRPPDFLPASELFDVGGRDYRWYRFQQAQ